MKSALNFQHGLMKLWETQINFAVHCATSGLGVSTEHLNAEQAMVRSLYRFHAYYHIRRTLRRMKREFSRIFSTVCRIRD